MKENLSKFKPYLANLVIIWLAILLYKTTTYYINFLRKEAIRTLIFLALAYTFLGLIYYINTPAKKIKESKGTLIFNFFKKLFNRKEKIDKTEKTALLFIIVKIFFLPIMLNFFFNNYFAIKNQFPNLISHNIFTIQGFNYIIFPFLLTLIFLIDTLWFAFGYTFESDSLKNKIRSVEPTIIGWMVALICYPPFNSIIGKHFGWFANDYVLFGTETTTFAIRLVVILLLSIYVSASIALGTRCSNLTNRGIVTRGPYSIIRHPAYIAKNSAWWITVIPVLSWQAALSMSIWSLMYHLRALTEERHLMKDPDYREYCKKVKYRYIPKIY